jgi:hypothetical protein
MKADGVNIKALEERRADISAKAQLGHLTRSSARTDRIILRLRRAANVAATATLRRRTGGGCRVAKRGTPTAPRPTHYLIDASSQGTR